MPISIFQWQRKKWLEDALTSMSVSPVERMLLCVKMIQEAEEDTEDGTEQQIKAVTELQDWGEDMDIANGWFCYKKNGYFELAHTLSMTL